MPGLIKVTYSMGFSPNCGSFNRIKIQNYFLLVPFRTHFVNYGQNLFFDFHGKRSVNYTNSIS